MAGQGTLGVAHAVSARVVVCVANGRSLRFVRPGNSLTSTNGVAALQIYFPSGNCLPMTDQTDSDSRYFGLLT